MNKQQASVLKLPDNYSIFNLTNEFDPVKINEFIDSGGYAVGGYNEKRAKMYLAPQYKNQRNIHIGIDFWAPAGETVYSALNGKVAYKANNAQEGNYGPTLVLQHKLEGKPVFALYGHLSLDTLNKMKTGQHIKAGQMIGRLGNEDENGNWPPHLHYQLSWVDPGCADMPGVVSEEEREKALDIYPDPRIVLGGIY